MAKEWTIKICDGSIIRRAGRDTSWAVVKRPCGPNCRGSGNHELDVIEKGEAMTIEPTTDGAPSHVLPGGGKMVKFPDGRIAGPYGGELLRQAKGRGAVETGVTVPANIKPGKTVEEQQASAAADEFRRDVAAHGGR
jgi:hypothetical protein